jgi:hypothetical protein
VTTGRFTFQGGALGNESMAKTWTFWFITSQ